MANAYWIDYRDTEGRSLFGYLAARDRAQADAEFAVAVTFTDDDPTGTAEITLSCDHVEIDSVQRSVPNVA